MAILRNETQKQYTNVDSRIFRDMNLKIKDRGLLTTLLSLPDNWEFSVMGLSKILPDGYNTIQNSLNRLETFGYLKRKKLKDERGRFYDVEWQVYETPIQITEKVVFPYSENPQSDCPSTVTPHTGKQRQSITNVSNTKKVITKEIETLPQVDYEKLVGLYGKELVDYQIEKIMQKGYKHSMNYKTIEQWCKDSKKVVAPMKRKNAFNNFPQREYDFDELERRLLSN